MVVVVAWVLVLMMIKLSDIVRLDSREREESRSR